LHCVLSAQSVETPNLVTAMLEFGDLRLRNLVGQGGLK
jgi:hypothetical protein